MDTSLRSVHLAELQTPDGAKASLSGLPAVLPSAQQRSPQEHLKELFDLYYDLLFRLLVGTGSAAADAEDCLQETFLRLFRALAKGEAIDQPRSWLFRVAYNIRIDKARRLPRSRFINDFELLKSIPDRLPTPEDQCVARERQARIGEALDRLPQRQREYLQLRAQGLKYREIAELFDVAIGTVAQACGLALEKLSEFRDSPEST